MSSTRVRATGSRVWLGWALVALAAAVAMCVVFVLAVKVGARPYRALGVTDPGIVVRLATPLLRLVADASAAMCTGALAFAVLLTPPRGSGGQELSGEGYRALRAAARWAVLWCGSAFALTTLSAASSAGLSIWVMSTPARWAGLVDAQEEPLTWLVTCVVVAVLAVGCRRVLTWRPVMMLLAVAVLALLPPLAAGHSSSDTNHDVATAAILIHVPAAAVWVGMLVMLIARVCRRGADVGAAAARYSRVATVCWVIVAGSGLVDASVLVPSWAGLIGSGYGQLVLAKIVIMVGLGVLVALGRRRAMRALRSGGRGPLIRLLAVELVALFAAIGASAGLTQLFPPAFLRAVTIPQTLLGYDLAGPPTLARLVLDWRYEVLFGSLAIGLAGGYVWAVWRLRRRGRRWQRRRTLGWLAGCLTLLVATCSGIGRYEPAMFSVHMASHMLLGFLAPGLLVQGAPITLALASSQVPEPGLPGMREWVGAAMCSRLVRFLTQPVVAFALFAGSPFVFYFSSAFDAAARFHWAHMAVDAYFLLVGYLFAWPIVGVDPAPRPLPNLVRLGMLLAAGPFTAVFAAVVISTSRVLGNGSAGYNMYRALNLPWVHGLLVDQRVGGVVALVLGEVCVFAATVVLLLRWGRVDDDPLASGMTRAGDLVTASRGSPGGGGLGAEVERRG